ncbi:MAG: hypothetical protein R2778_02225 [Saprospiraceae bacterium]
MILVENHKLPIVSYRVFVNYDPVLEKKAAAGYLQLFGELLSTGTKIRTKSQINSEIDFIGASLNSSSHELARHSCLKKYSPKLLTDYV